MSYIRSLRSRKARNVSLEWYRLFRKLIKYGNTTLLTLESNALCVDHIEPIGVLVYDDTYRRFVEKLNLPFPEPMHLLCHVKATFACPTC